MAVWEAMERNLVLARCVEYARARSPLYREKFADLPGFQEGITKAEFEAIPFTDKADIRAVYPLGLCAAAERDIVRVHSSSGTTGSAILMPYTRRDLDDWTAMMSRCLGVAGVGALDRVQITPGFGLWTAGMGFQAGAERLGAMVIPMGPGHTEKQIQMLIDLKATVLCATASYALLLSEQARERGISSKLHLKKVILGSEVCQDKMVRAIRRGFGAVGIYDIYGLTEIYGPGIAISCDERCGLHYWDDYLYFEVIDPRTGCTLPVGQAGELVITSFRKEGSPLIRFRTHDIARLLPGQCRCGRPYPLMSRIGGRTDETVKVKGVQVHPQQIGELLTRVPDAEGEFLVILDRAEGRERMTIRFEIGDMSLRCGAEAAVRDRMKGDFGLSVIAEAVERGALPRSEKKTRRIDDRR